MPQADLSEKLRQRLVGRVRAVFHDVEGGEQSVPPSDEALFERDSPIRLVHADVVSMMVGGIRSLLLQMLHPHALQGVLDHSNFRSDMHGRLRRTARSQPCRCSVYARCAVLLVCARILAQTPTHHLPTAESKRTASNGKSMYRYK